MFDTRMYIRVFSKSVKYSSIVHAFLMLGLHLNFPMFPCTCVLLACTDPHKGVRGVRGHGGR